MNRWWVKLSRYALPQSKALLLILTLMLVGIGLGLLAPWPLKLIVDCALSGKPLPGQVAWLRNVPGAGSASGMLAYLAAATVGLFLSRRLVAIMQSYVEAGAGSRIVYELATDLFDHVQRRSMLFYARQRAGDLVRRVTADTGCVRELIMHVYLPLVGAIVTVFSTFIIMWHLCPPLAIFALALTLPLGIIIRLFARPMSERKHHEWELQGQISALVEQTLTAIPMVQAFGREDYQDTRFRQVARRTVQANLRSELSQHQFRVSTGAVNAAALAVVMILGGIAAVEGHLTIGSVLVLVSYFAALYSPIETLAYLSEGFASASAGARRVLEILEADEVGVVDSPDAKPLQRGDPSSGITVRFDNVTFGYEPDRPVLQDVSLAAHAGETIALVGVTGAGKSTLVSLIPRFFDPWQGTIYFNDTDIRRIQLSDIRKHVAIVLQEPFLLPLSIADNIAYGRPEASRQEIIAAADAANAVDFIERLPAGYDTLIGERGSTLSGGEKQRLSIARALLTNAPILVLDEPTAALDARTEAALVAALERLMQGRTTFIIAHRLSTICRATRIIVLEHGRCSEQGTHDELLSTGGSYYRFNESRSSEPMAGKDAALAERLC